MLNIQFFGQNLHFAIGVFASLTLFAVAWLYFDAWTNKKTKNNLLRWLGFFLLSISFLVYAVDIPWIGTSTDKDSQYRLISNIIRVFGYLFVIMAELMDPLQKVPKHDELEPQKSQNNTQSFSFLGFTASTIKALPVAGAILASFLYFRRSTKGLERHLKPLALGFICLALFEILAQAYLLRDSTNVVVSQAVAVYGPMWWAENIVLLLASIILGRWVWRYLVKRFMSQLFMVFVTGIIIIFLVTTLTFTFLLLKNIQNATLSNLSTTANVLNYAFDSKRSETIASSEALSYNPEYASAIINKDHKKLVQLSADYLATKKQSRLLITNDSGQVLLRGEDTDRWGDSVSSNPLVRKALVGQASSSISTVSGVVAPTMLIESTSPVRDGNNLIIGTITTGVAMDDSFVDGIKNSTGLDASIYSGNIRSSTTTLTADGKSRWVGVKEHNKSVNDTVLKSGKTFSGQLDILNRPYLAVYRPLKDVDNVVIGMILVAQPQTQLLSTANQSIQLTFILATVLLLLSIFPAYVVSRYIVRQI